MRRLLKSWATPPVSWPSASSFCDCASCCLHLLELELGLAAFGDVAGDLGEADQPVSFADRVDDDAGPEERAVLADAPAFLFVAALFLGNAQRAGWLAVGAVGIGVEAGEVLPDDLLWRIALDPLTADIPAGHDAGRVQHVERIVDDALRPEDGNYVRFRTDPVCRCLSFPNILAPDLVAETCDVRIGSANALFDQSPFSGSDCGSAEPLSRCHGVRNVAAKVRSAASLAGSLTFECSITFEEPSRGSFCGRSDIDESRRRDPPGQRRNRQPGQGGRSDRA